jgi:hypothetical protein
MKLQIGSTGWALVLVTAMFTGRAEAAAGIHTPTAGMGYAEVRASLLREGMEIAPDPVRRPDKTFHEIDCDMLGTWHYCEARFLWRQKNGWRQYFVVDVDPNGESVVYAGDPMDAEGLPSIPPPLANDVPQLTGSYLAARAQLKRLGFRPAHRPGEQAHMCPDEACRTAVTVPEAECSGTGLGYCNAYWISRNGRVLEVYTIGEHPSVHYVSWTTQQTLQDFVGNAFGMDRPKRR